MKNPRSIRGKLGRLVLISVGLALAVVAALGLWAEARRYILVKRDTLVATAQVFSSASAKAVASRDNAAIIEAIRAMGRVPGLLYAEVEDTGGATLAQIGGTVRLAGDLELDETGKASPLHLLASRTVQISVPVIDGGRTIGRLVLVSETSDLFARLESVLVTAGIGFVLAVTIGLLTSLRLQRSITQPLVLLERTMADIERSHDYSATIEVDSDDEIGALASSFNSMIHQIRERDGRLADREEEIIFRLSRAAERRDDQTGQHIIRMATLCLYIAQELGLDAKTCESIHRVAPMHDVGKIGVPDSIMLKPGKLDPEERKQIEKHAYHGYEILRDSSSELIQLGAEIALSHHERWDGTGYPLGLEGDQIPLAGRIAAVADVCDALACKRPYKPAWSLEAVQTYLVTQAGTQFDPDCVQALVRRWADVRAIYSDPEAKIPAGIAQVA